ncbi:glycosyltransferase [Lutibacter maritimus]|uniref:Glycosyltransferase involved in cell wall bisynthesis n=1 Tax=Lutibacter maritimus TaxID=593133 RepID=A0A1I6QMP4_9FLAO|nr:glycosyltransferase [Lutibacter maritimus]SFS53706.1 Glycosyltransferase involved in cell wall bisynthesis [Lutibacter maritimus]
MTYSENNQITDLSIIIPVYNVEKYIERCFNAISNVYKSNNKIKIEVVFINDGSTDNSLLKLVEFRNSYNYVKIISQPNLGLSEARNTGIKNANGRYLLFLDSDDWIDLDVILKQLTLTFDNKLDFLSFGMRYFFENNDDSFPRPLHPINYNKIHTGIEFLTQGYQPSSSCLFLLNRNFIIDNNLLFTPKISQQDVEFTVRLMLCAHRGYFSELIGYNYFRNFGTISLPQSQEKLEKYLSDAIIVAELIKSNIKNYDIKDKDVIKTIQKNYNSVIWNLLWRFIVKPKEVSYPFKVKCIHELSNKKLYPIKGALKTRFQRITCLFFNVETLLKLFYKFKSH